MSNKNIICKVLLTNALLALLIVPASHNANAQLVKKVKTATDVLIKGSGKSSELVEQAVKGMKPAINTSTPSKIEEAFSMMGMGTSGHISMPSSYSTTDMNPADIPAVNSSIISSPSLSEMIELPPLHKKILAERPVFALEGPHNQLLKERGIAFRAVYTPQTKDLTHFTIEFETALGQPSRLHLPEQQFDFLTEALHQDLYFAKEGEGFSATLRAGITKDHPVQFIFSPKNEGVVIKIQKEGVPFEHWPTASKYEYMNKNVIPSLVYLLKTKKLFLREAANDNFIFSISPTSHIEWAWDVYVPKKIHPNLSDLQKAEGLIGQLKAAHFQVAPVRIHSHYNGVPAYEIPNYVEVKSPFDTTWRTVRLEDYWVKNARKSLQESYAERNLAERRLENEKLLQERTELFNHGLIVKNYVPGPQGTFEFKSEMEAPFMTANLDKAQKEIFDKAYRSNLKICYLEDLGFGYLPVEDFPIAWNNALPKKLGNYAKVLKKWELASHSVKYRLKTGTRLGEDFYQDGLLKRVQDNQIGVLYFTNDIIMLNPETVNLSELSKKLDKALDYLEKHPRHYVYMYKTEGTVNIRLVGENIGPVIKLAPKNKWDIF